MKQKKLKAVLSCLLSACLPLSMMGASSAYAITPDEEPPAPTGVNTPESFVLPDIVSAAEAEENGYIGRDYTAEHDLSTFVFKNEDGTGTMRVYSHPVKYYDERGKVRDISLDLAKDADGKIVTAKNNIKTAFPEVLSEGIALSHEDIDLLMVPITDNANAVAEFDEKARTVSYRIDDRTAYVYGLTYTGFKEDIVVSEYTGQTDYRFTLYTNGLALKEDDGVFMLTDKEGEPTAYLSDIVVYTADGGNNTVGAMNCEAVVENEQYALTVHLDEDYLRDEATVYPIRIDPSITVNSGATAIEGKTLYEDNSTSSSLIVGKTGTFGRARFLLHFPNLDVSPIKSSLCITSASIELTNYQPNDNTTVRVLCYQFDTNWFSNSTWSSLEQNEGYTYTQLSAKNISYSIGVNHTPQHRYSFDVTQAAKRWVAQKDALGNYYAFSPATGLLFSSTAESGTTVKYKQFYDCSNSSNGPTLKINYSYSIPSDEFFSSYTPQKYNTDVDWENYTYSSLIQYRMDCYGYSFGFVYNDKIHEEPSKPKEPYKQQPGEFAQSLGSVQHPTVYEEYNVIMSELINNMTLDANRWGYTITQYMPTSSVIPQSTTGLRKVALVTGKYWDKKKKEYKLDFHFYMQHSDGTWSHKPGSTEVSNLSIDTDQLLTNENIMSLANQGKYICNEASGDPISNYQLRFFEISKKPTIDFPHDSRSIIWYNPSAPLTAIYNSYEKGGDCIEAANYTTIADSYNRLSQIDYAKDEDYCYFICTSQGNYTISTYYDVNQFSDFVPNMYCVVYNNSGVPLASYTGTGNVSLNTHFGGGNKYVVRIWCDNTACIGNTNNDTQTPFKYYLRIRSSD